MNLLFFFIISLFSGAYSMQLPTNSLGELNKLSPQLIEQMPLYIGRVSKDADEAVQTLIKLSRVNKYGNALVKRYFTESEEAWQHVALYEELFTRERWHHANAAIFVLFGMKAIERKQAWLDEKLTINDKIEFNKKCFEYAIHANKNSIVTQIKMTLLPGELRIPDACHQYRQGRALLQIAIENNSPVIVRRLLDLKADPKDLVTVEINENHKLVTTDLLAFAKQKGNQEIITMLDNAINPQNGVEVSLGEFSLR